MKVRRFLASTTRDALRDVRDVLGPDALILSNRQVAGGGVELIAAAEDAVASLTGVSVVSAASGGRPSTSAADKEVRVEPVPPEELPSVFQRQRVAASTPPPPAEPPAVLTSNRQPPTYAAPEAFQRPTYKKNATSAAAASPSPAMLRGGGTPERAPAAPAATMAPSALNGSGSPGQTELHQLMHEVKLLRGMLEGQLAGFAWSELQRLQPHKVETFRQVLQAGYSPLVGRQLLQRLPSGLDSARSRQWVKTALQHNLPVLSSMEDIVERGGVYALVGPTGVGKTTTVAKLAARCTLRYGPERVALLTTDSYRIGAHDQLRIYGKILGVPVYAIKDESDLQLTLADLSQRHLVLIDTVGMGQRDQRLEEHMAMLCGVGQAVQRLLLLPATAQANTLSDVVRRYQGSGLAGCVLTKIDESMQLGGVLDVIIRLRLKLFYVTNGQRVPEDLHLANPAYLVDRSLRPADNDPAYQAQTDEWPLLYAAMQSGLTEGLGAGLSGVLGHG